MENPTFAIEKANAILKQRGVRHRLENQYTCIAPLTKFLLQMTPLVGFIKALFILMLGSMVMLAFQVSQSLISNLVKNKTYENAMLRCLGWKQNHIVLITIQKVALFLVIPGLVVGVFFAFSFTYAVKLFLEQQTKRELVFEFKLQAYLIAVFVAWVLPLLSMIVPVFNSLAIELRDALDLFRDKHS